MKKVLVGLFLISNSMVITAGQSASALSPAHPSCISFLQKIKEANNSGVDSTTIRQALDGYKRNCSGETEYTQTRLNTRSSLSYSCEGYMQKIKEANDVGVDASEIRQFLNKYDELCSDGNKYTGNSNTTTSKPIVEKVVDGVLTITNY